MRKSMRITIAATAAAILAAAALTGCGAGGRTQEKTGGEYAADDKTAAAEPGSPENEAENSSGTVTVTTGRGTAELPVNPGRVVVFDMGILDSMEALGVEVEAAVPTASLLSGLSKYESAVNAGGIKEPDLEAIYEFEPDLIIISGRQEAFYDELSGIAPTWYVETEYENLMKNLTANYTVLGQIFGKEEAVSAALDEIGRQIASVKARADSMEEKALILLANDGAISAYGSGSRFGLIHDVLGVRAADAAIDASTHGQSVGYEYIAGVNPDILFVVDRAAVVAGSTDAGDTLDNDLVRSTNAYKNGKIVHLDAENWYLAGAGLRTLPEMIGEVETALY